MDAFNILSSVDQKLLDNGLLSVSDRYYEHKYCNKIKEIENVHQRVSFHSNRVCMISLTENHPVLNNKIKDINWKINKNINREDNVVSGKSKRHAQKLEPNSIICFIETMDGAIYPVYSCMQGKLIEINNNIKRDPNLLQRKPVSDGYIALILPNLKTFDTLKNSMLTNKEYNQLVMLQ